MQIGIGISTGTEVVCAALVVERHNGTRTIEYRTVSADRDVNSDIGDLVVSAIELVASLAPRLSTETDGSSRRAAPDAIAVSYRTAEQASSIRTALSHSTRCVLLVPESAAGLAFLDDAGLVARYDTVAVVDIGASGATATIVDPTTGVVLATDRTELVGGNVANDLVRGLTHGALAREDRGRGTARFRAAKEHLSTYDVATVGGHAGATVDRESFEEALRPRATDAAEFTATTATAVGATPNAVVLIGGVANTPVVRGAFESALGLPTLVPDEPDTVLAQGAALVALDAAADPSAAHALYSTAGLGASNGGRAMGKHSGAVVAAVVAGAIMLAYGFQALTPSGEAGVSPAGTIIPTQNEAGGVAPVVEEPVVEEPASSEATSDSDAWGNDSSFSGVDTTSAPSTTPTLHPAPDLAIIPWPARSSTSQLTPDPTSGPPESETATESPSQRTPSDETTPNVTPPDVTPTPIESDPSIPEPTPPAPVTPEPDTSAPAVPDEGTSEPTTPEPTTPPAEGTPTETTPVGTTPAESGGSTPVTAPTTDADSTSSNPDVPSTSLTPPPTVWTPTPSGTN